MASPFANFSVFQMTRHDDTAFRAYEAIVQLQVDGSANPDDPEFKRFVSVDPPGSVWKTFGLVHATTEGDYFHDLNNAVLLAVQFNERILPGKVRDERVASVVKDLEDREGRKVGKKVFREIRDEVEQELLPKAFIRRSRVYVAITSADEVILFSTSGKRQDDIVSLLWDLFDWAGLEPHDKDSGLAMEWWDQHKGIEVSPSGIMLNVHQANQVFDLPLETGSTAVLDATGDAAAQVVRLKNVNLACDEVNDFLKQGYRFKEMALVKPDEFSFRLTDKWQFKGFDLADTTLKQHEIKAKDTANFHGFAWLTVTIIKAMLEDLLACASTTINSEEEL